jgi:imidazolonepropionase-like amidohydrolase
VTPSTRFQRFNQYEAQLFKLVKCKSLIDGTGAPAVAGACLLIEDDRIADIGVQTAFKDLPPGTAIIDLDNSYVMPGLINAHTHLSLVPGKGNQPAQKRLPPGINVLRSVPNLLKDVYSGVTTTRIMGEENYIDIDFKKAIDGGIVNGPRIITAGIALSASHSHGVGLRPADGKQEIRKLARQNLAQGADFIKLFATGGASSPGKALHSCPYSREEIAAAVEEAERAGTYVAAHAHGGTGLDLCIEEGVRTIEHGAFIHEKQLNEIIRKNLWIVGTFSILFHPEGIEGTDFSIPLIKSKVLRAREAAAENFARIIKSGANLAIGTDSVHGEMPYEMEKLVEFGASTMQAIQAATKNAARVCRVEDTAGTLEVGKSADFIALAKDPLENISHLRTITEVYIRGKRFQGV